MEILVLDLHTQKDLTEGPKISQALQKHSKISTYKLFSPDFSYKILKDFRGIVLTGSDNPDLLISHEISKLKPYLLNISKYETQVLGICAGNEVLADTFNYRLRRFAEPEVGFPWINLTEKGVTDPLFHGFPEKFRFFEYHIKSVKCSDREKILAENDFCPQTILYDSTIHGVQFHPEDTYATAKEFLKNAREGKYVSSIPSEPIEDLGDLLFKNFVNVVRRQ